MQTWQRYGGPGIAGREAFYAHVAGCKPILNQRRLYFTLTTIQKGTTLENRLFSTRNLYPAHIRLHIIGRIFRHDFIPDS
jgi:hypothetical protein